MPHGIRLNNNLVFHIMSIALHPFFVTFVIERLTVHLRYFQIRLVPYLKIFPISPLFEPDSTGPLPTLRGC